MKTLLRSPVAAVVLIYVILACGFSLVVPVFNGPDEPFHFAYVRYVAQTGSLPDQTRPETTVPGEGHGPPLYYAIGAGFLKLVSSNDAADLVVPTYDDLERFVRSPQSFPLGHFRPPLNANYLKWGRGQDRNMFLTTADDRFPFGGSTRTIHLLRLLSVAAGAITVLFVARIAAAVRPEDPVLPVVAAAIAGFNPQFTFVHGLINNDVLGIALATVGLWLLTRFVMVEESGKGWLAAAGACAGLALLAKSNTSFLIPLFLAAIVVGSLRGSGAGRYRKLARDLGVFCGALAIVAGWYYVRNVALYGSGDPLGLKIFKEHHPQLVISEQIRGHVLRNIFFQRLFTSFWGQFDWLTIPLPQWLYLAYGALTAVVVPGAVRLWRSTVGPLRTGMAFLGASMLLVLASLLWLNFGASLMAAQGRLAWPALAAFCVFAAVGVLRLGRGLSQRALGIAVAGFLVALVALNVFCMLVVVYPVYR